MNKHLLAVLSATGFAFGPTIAAHAQSATAVLEEIIVTATKREESLQDVPVSVSALTGEKIADNGLRALDEISTYVPNFSVQKDPIGDKINIRGVQSGNQAGFEQSVSTYVDGIYRGRGTQSRFAFLDVGLVEVLRGPQGTLFGKNTIGGAINIRSAKPTDEFAAALSAKYNTEFDETELLGFVSGPLSEALRGRAAFLVRDMQEGWVENVAYSEDNPAAEDFAARGLLDWDIGEDTRAEIKLEYGNFKVTGQPWDLITVGALAAFGLQGNTDGVANMGNRPEFFESVFGAGAAGDTGPIDFGSVALIDGEVSELAATVVHTLADTSTVTAIVGYSAYDFLRFLDADFNPLPAVRFDDSEDFEQSSIEVRYASSTDNELSFMAGLYYQFSSLFADGLSYFNSPALNALTGGGCVNGGGTIQTTTMDLDGDGAVTPNDSVVATLLGNAQLGVPAALARTCVNGLATTGLPGFNRYATLDQETDSSALFVEFRWDVAETITTRLGLRYTVEDKSAKQGVYAADYAARGTVRNDTPAFVTGLAVIGEATPHQFDNLSRDEQSFTWSLTGQWDYNDDSMLYATASTGFKSGGFNSFAFSANPAEAEYGEEDALTVEVGGKFTLLDGAGELNVAIFNTSYDDLQTSLFAGSTSFIVQNAAEATTRGIELDGRWLVSESVSVNGALGYTDFEFDGFPNAGCTVDQLLALRENQWASGAGNILAPLLTLQNCSALAINDLSGRTSENTPELSATIGIEHFAPIGQRYELHSALDINYQDEQFRQSDLDPFALDDSFIRINAVVTFGRDDGAWDVSLIGRNLSDETNINYLNDTPLFDGARQTALLPPRSIEIRGRVRF